MLASLIYFTQAFCAVIFLFLACYLVSGRSRDSGTHLLSLLALLFAFESYSMLLTVDPSRAEIATIPLAIRLRWAFSAAIPILYHFLALRRRDPPVHWPNWRYFPGLVLMAVYGALAVIGEPLFADVINRGPAGGYTHGLVLTSVGEIMVAVNMFYALGISLPAAVISHDQAENRASRADSRRLLITWGLVLLSWVIGIHSLSVPQTQTIFGVLNLVQRSLMIAAGLILVEGVMRSGSPAGERLDPHLMPAARVGLAFAIVHLSLLLWVQDLVVETFLVPMLAMSALTGVFFARGERRWIQYIFGSGVDEEKEIEYELRQAWHLLAEGAPAGTTLQRVRRLLDQELGAEFILVMTVEDDQEPVVLKSMEKKIVLQEPAETLPWPLSFSSPAARQFHLEGFSERPGWLLPVQQRGSFYGALVLGLPGSGAYSPFQLELAAEYADMMAYAINRILRSSRTAEPAAFTAVHSPESARVQIHSLGQFRLFANGQNQLDTERLPLRAWQVLAHLVAALEEPVPSANLKAQLWPEGSQTSAANNLHVAVHALRQWLATATGMEGSGLVQYQGGEYSLNLDPEVIWLDALAFRQYYRRGQAFLELGSASEAADAYQAAIDLYEGPFLNESELELPVEVEITRHRFQRRYGEMAVYLVARALDTGNLHQVEELLLRGAGFDAFRPAQLEELLARYEGTVGPSQARTLRQAVERLREGT